MIARVVEIWATVVEEHFKVLRQKDASPTRTVGKSETEILTLGGGLSQEPKHFNVTFGRTYEHMFQSFRGRTRDICSNDLLWFLMRKCFRILRNDLMRSLKCDDYLRNLRSVNGKEARRIQDHYTNFAPRAKLQRHNTSVFFDCRSAKTQEKISCKRISKDLLEPSAAGRAGGKQRSDWSSGAGCFDQVRLELHHLKRLSSDQRETPLVPILDLFEDYQYFYVMHPALTNYEPILQNLSQLYLEGKKQVVPGSLRAQSPEFERFGGPASRPENGGKQVKNVITEQGWAREIIRQVLSGRSA